MLSDADTAPAALVYPVNTLFITVAFGTVVRFPVDVTSPVKFAFVTTVVAFPAEVTIPVKLALVAVAVST